MLFINLRFKIILFFIVISVIIANFSSVFADDLENDFSLSDETIIQSLILETSNSVSNEPITNSKNIVAIDRLTNTILYEKNSKERVPMASTTKIMTCILAIESNRLDEIVTVSKKAATIHGSTLGIKENMKIPLKTLLYGLMLRSRK